MVPQSPLLLREPGSRIAMQTLCHLAFERSEETAGTPERPMCLFRARLHPCLVLVDGSTDHRLALLHYRLEVQKPNVSRVLNH